LQKLRSIFNKTLVFVILTLFLCLVISPSAQATYTVGSNPQKKVEYEVIISYIKGFGFLNWLYNWGRFRGEAALTIEGDIGGFKLCGFRWSNGCVEYFEEIATYVYAYHFIGWMVESDYLIPLPFVRGFARGDIKWY
jgi:hypothetical protein